MDPTELDDAYGRMDWSDADLFGFLDSLVEPSPSTTAEAVKVPMDGDAATSLQIQNNAVPAQYAAMAPPQEMDLPGVGPASLYTSVQYGQTDPLDLAGSIRQAGNPPFGQDSGGGSSQHSGEQDDSRHNGARKSSTSGDEKQDIPIRKPGFDREKNRAAQRAFRMRKKEKEKAKETELEQLSAKLQAVQLEKQRLQQQNKLLESALVARVRIGADAQPALPPFPSTRDQQAMPGRLISGAGDWKSNVEWGREDILVLEHGLQLKLTYSMLSQMQLSDFVKSWKVMVNKIAALLCEAWKDPNGSAGQEVKLLVSECIALCAFIARNSPKLMYLICSTRLEDIPVMHQTASPSFWQSVLDNMQLSAEQKEQVLDARRKFFRMWGALLQERMCLERIMKDAELKMTEDTAQQYSRLISAAKQLKTNVESMHKNKCIFFSKCWREILQPVQGGRLIVQSYPHPPNLLSVIARLAEEAKEPAAQKIMKAAAEDAAASSSHVLITLAG